VSDERGHPPVDDSFEVDPNDAVLKQTTAVVKTVMELSNKVPISRPSDYVDLVRVRGEEREKEREPSKENPSTLKYIPYLSVQWVPLLYNRNV
jgi:hypothetical protein